MSQVSKIRSETHIGRGRYELLDVAGRGGMAVVWRAKQLGDVGFERIVAVKQMHEHLSASKLYIDMFAEEARACAALQSPNIPQIYDFLREDNRYYLVLEWIDGVDLGSLIRHISHTNQKMSWEMCAAIGVGVLRGLADAHEREDQDGRVCPVLHRDISPHNILITARGMVKLIDFGLCLTSDRKKSLTEPGVVKGKMSYLSPEIVQGKRPTTRSDQFSLGSVLWESLAGKKLFDGDSDFEVYGKIREGRILPLRPLRKDIPRAMNTVLYRSLAAKASERYPTSREMGKALAAVLKSLGSPAQDLHALIGHTVTEAREALGMGKRTGQDFSVTPTAAQTIDKLILPESGSDLDLSLCNDRPRARHATAPMTLDWTDTTKSEAKPKGLLHRLAFFGRK